MIGNVRVFVFFAWITLVVFATLTEATLLAYQHPKSDNVSVGKQGTSPDESSQSQATVDFQLTTGENLTNYLPDSNESATQESNSLPTDPVTQDDSTLNVLIIGSQFDTSKVFWTEKSRAFKASPIRDELQRILEGGINSNDNLAGFSKANVVFEERYDFFQGNEVFNLASWFHWPVPKENNTRFSNLRNEGPTMWDYIILIEDPYTIEKMPGVYAHGVAIISEEIARSPSKKAEVVLLMAWPNQVSDSTVDHYKEVTYRTGRSGGFKVAPAGLAWQAAGSPEDTEDDAYIAAASIYSRIWGKSADSLYAKDELATTVDLTVVENIGKSQYSGKWEGKYLGVFKNITSPFTMNYDRSNPLRMRWAIGGTSTEQQLTRTAKDAMSRAGNTQQDAGGDVRSVYVGRNPIGTDQKSYKNVQPRDSSTFGYEYQSEDGNDQVTTFLNIFSKEMVLAKSMMSWGSNARLIPRRMMIADGIKEFPDMKLQSDGSHLSWSSRVQVGTFMYTMVSGRTPVDRQPKNMTEIWYSQKIGYETAWHFGTLSVRAPGFKVKPVDSWANVPNDKQGAIIPSGSDGKIEVEFLFPPREEIEVAVSVSGEQVVVSPLTLLFTVENYNMPQTVTIEASEAKIFTVSFSTKSNDEAYNNLDDRWVLSFV